ncbi:hypothetical protein SAMN05216475_4033 [Pseudomonas synxantha]|uniref:Uncharacterized protein n=1 Tax=Pseudomonas synxantha TaxID=47883 RepID=A0AAX3ICB2_9PSED|nr:MULTISPECIES: hypothetical protein [Pseudomonas]AZE65539.1 hypothetical protein C4K01_1327 [Pseudomonas synxantha]KRP56565.1 hypothetical protein TU77_03470 [Pseudomonas synxantha]MDT3228434.1 hypothetical protein [Pseudomonas sp. rhizo25]SDU51136.1 hypothetical protein SAMN05216475_4033 [Pseudomonas synxantha]VTR03814.1 Uncharacterised protein [Pseudomonas synxantha]
MIDVSQLQKIKSAQELEDDLALDQAHGYLRDSDWYALAQMEEGILMPADIQAARNAARATIYRLGEKHLP